MQNIDFLIGLSAWFGFALSWAMLLDSENKQIKKDNDDSNKKWGA